jgi:hypothetical protein
MLNRDFAGTTARIASTTNITPVEQVDYAGALKNFLNEYRTSADRYEKQKDKELLKSKTDALTNAIKGGNQDEINNALATVDPVAYAQMLKSDAQRAEDRKWALDDATTKHQRDLEIAKIKNKGLVNINMSNPFDKKRIETRAKNMDENIAKSQSQIDTYNKAEALLNKGTFDTGGISDFLAPITTRFNQDASDFQAEVNKIVPTMRPTGSGSTSDRDMAVFEKATFGFGKPKETNLNIIKGRRAVEENNIAKEELFAQYITSGMGTPADFDREWRKYLNANPIFGDDKGSTLNKNRVNAYDWFSKPQAPSLKQVNQAKDFSSMSNEDLLKGL